MTFYLFFILYIYIYITHIRTTFIGKNHHSQLPNLIPAMSLFFSSTKVCLNNQEVPPLKLSFDQCKQAEV